MKNDLTADEWLALAFFLSGQSLFSGRVAGKTNRIQAFQRAREKVIKVGEDISDTEGHYEVSGYVRNIPDDERWAGELD